MNRLPLPNWNCPPNLNARGDFSSVLNCGYGGLPFIGQPYHPTLSHVFVPRPPFQAGFQELNSQCVKPIKTTQCQSSVPKSEHFYCDVCERSFKTKQILEAHLQSHVKCDSEGCSYTASRKMLKLHFIQNHAKGRMRIKLDTPEQLEKWKEQRRKRYPTIENVQKKLAEERARRENGQVAETQTFRYRGKRQRNNFHRNRQKYSKHQNQSRQGGIHNDSEEVQVNQQTGDKRKTETQVVDPLSLLLDSSNNDSVGEEKPLVQPSATGSTSALMSLCGYGGDSSSDESDTEKEVNNNKQAIKPIQGIKSDQQSSQNTELPSPPQKISRKRKQEMKKNKGANTKKKVTLLEKLLAPEIRHENNVILQCIRYIVQNNYFDDDE